MDGAANVSPAGGPDVETASDDYARRFEGAAGKYLLSVQAACIASLLPAGSGLSVLDVGGGHGQTSRLLLELGHHVTVLGSAPAAHQRLRSCADGHRLRLVTGELLRLPFVEASFDVVVSVRLVSHMSDWAGLIGELCRVSRRSVIVDYPRTSGLNALTPWLFRIKKGLEGNTRPYRSFGDAEIEGAFRAHGFRPGALKGQFCLPMVLHRVTGAGPLSRGMEGVCRRLGLDRSLGSPVMLRADRP